MNLKRLIEDVRSARIVGGNVEEWESTQVTGLSDDSRFIRKGDLFFCRKGQSFDTHEFAFEVKRKGAAAIVVERELEVE